MAYNLSPIGNEQYSDANGAPYSGAKLFIYTAGSSSKVTTYQDNAGGTPHTNPIILNTKGEIADGSGNRKPIWLPSGISYKFILAPSTDTDPPTSSYWTEDNIVGINDTTVTISEWITGPTPTYVSATKFTLAGDQISAFNLGRRVKTTNSGGTIYATIVAVDFNVTAVGLTTVTVTNDSGNLDSGLSAVFYGIVSSTNTSLPQPASSGLISSDATGGAGPIFTLSRNSASPLAGDVLGGLDFYGRDSGAASQLYGRIYTIINNTTAGIEEGVFTISGVSAGAEIVSAQFKDGQVLGAPTGSFKGAGTINAASGVYENGVRVSPIVPLNPGGTTFTGAGSVVIGSSAGNILIDWTIYPRYLIEIQDISISVAEAIYLRVYQDGGTTPQTDASYTYAASGWNTNGAAATLNSGAAAFGALTGALNNTSNRELGQITLKINNPAKTGSWKSIRTECTYDDSSVFGTNITGVVNYTGNTNAINGIKIYPVTGSTTITCKVYVYGVR